MAVRFRRAARADLSALVALMADDDVNGWREEPGEPLAPGYLAAFVAIEGDPNNVLVVGEREGRIVATGQVSFVPTLANKGSTRAIIEAVRVCSDLRSQGIGEALLRHLEDLARERGCSAAQLTTSRARVDAHRLYERIGYRGHPKGDKREF